MKFIIVFACVCAICIVLAEEKETKKEEKETKKEEGKETKEEKKKEDKEEEKKEEAKVIKQEQEVNPEDFHYILEIDNSIKAEQEGKLQKDKKTWVVKGEYSYKTKDGKNVHVTYTADELGYRPHVDTDH